MKYENAFDPLSGSNFSKVSYKKVLSKKTTGIHHLEKFHGLVILNIPIDINGNTIETYYLNVKNEKLSLWFKPQLYEPQEFFIDKKQEKSCFSFIL